jgi:phosphoribosyl 1,2-cyclic phosphodiesterase
MRVKFWGVRGNVVMPGPFTIEYGGNTSCIEIRGDNNELLIIDAGTGLRELGMWLMGNDFKDNKEVTSNILLTHTHWDHIQGFPFYIPIFFPQNNITFFGPVSKDDTLEDVVAGQMNYAYFPIKLDELKAKIRFRDVVEGEFDINGFKIKTKYINHNVPAFSYRIEHGGKSVVTMFDMEPYRNRHEDQKDKVTKEEYEEGQAEVDAKENEIIDFARGADLIIHDAMYSKEEYYEKKTGWGHSYFEYAVFHGVKANARMLALFHHEYEDGVLSDYEKMAKQYAKDLGSECVVFAAREGLEITV